MPIERTSVILKDAEKHGYGVAAFNIFNYETIAWAIQAAEEERIPVIIQFYPGFDRFIPMEVVTAATKALAAKASIPVGLHLDHSNKYEDAIRGAECGFTSIMIDGSTLDFDENADLTKRVVDTAHKMGVEVEAELGHVGSGNNIDDFTNSSHFTDPEDAIRFIEITNADSLAVSVGNGHGHYVATPSLDFDRIQDIHDSISVPIVMHGGSDIPDDQIQRSIACGMSKFNIATEYNRSFYNAMKKCMEEDQGHGYMFRCLAQAENEVKEFLKAKLRVLNPKSYRL
ncbi:MAG TPA: class II fructose-bisphosphate aldolase [Clostridia bacterium]|nr:class II fructose-bisphosphate aldolase [Clostridia bacterium]